MRQQEMENKEPMDQSPEETVEAPAPEAAEAQEPALEEEAPQPAGEAEKLQEALGLGGGSGPVPFVRAV